MDVGTLLDDKSINYKSQGRDYVVKCLNPEHDDSNPSMRIDKISGLFNCLSCGFGGDIFDYFSINKEKFINIKVNELKEKIQNLLAQKSIQMPLDAIPFKDDFRGIKGSTYEVFGAFTTETLRGMEGRIVFPIKDILGNINAFQGRYMYSDLNPKYKFYPEHTTVNFHPMIPKPIDNSIILVEGIFDMINLWDKGLYNAVTSFGISLGTVKRDKKKAAVIDKFNVFKLQGIETVWIMYDGDERGKNAAEGLKEILKQSRKFFVDTIDLEEGMDPGELTLQDVTNLKEKLYGE